MRLRLASGGGVRPPIPAPVAAAVTGLAVGVLTVGLVSLGLLGCEAIRGTSSCGGPGFAILAVIIAAMVVVGTTLLRLTGVPDAGTITVLAVAVVLLFVLIFLIGWVFSLWMWVVLPLLSAASFALASVLTAALARAGRPDAYDEQPPSDEAARRLSENPPDEVREADEIEPDDDQDHAGTVEEEHDAVQHEREEVQHEHDAVKHEHDAQSGRQADGRRHHRGGQQ